MGGIGKALGGMGGLGSALGGMLKSSPISGKKKDGPAQSMMPTSGALSNLGAVKGIGSKVKGLSATVAGISAGITGISNVDNNLEKIGEVLDQERLGVTEEVVEDDGAEGDDGESPGGQGAGGSQETCE